MKKLMLFFTLLTGCFLLNAQDEAVRKSDSVMIKKLFDHHLTASSSYDWLRYLSNEIGGRLSGSVEAEQAVAYTERELKKLKFDRVWLQKVMVPKWVRGTPEFAFIESSPGVTTDIPIAALGGSIATPALGIKAEVVEVKSFEELAALGKRKISGKIVFYNRPMDPTLINTFASYGGCVNQRYSGAEEAAKYGALGVIVRSMNLRLDDFPHTGSMSYGELTEQKRIPAAAISTNAAELLSATLALNPKTKLYFKQSCKQLPDVESFNVIAEIKGSTYPDEFIVVGGHLDSWDIGDGSHDDGAGVVQSMAVLESFKALNYRPKRSIRVVLFMNEENGMRGGNEYANQAKRKGEQHIFALESDSGAFTPRGFSFDTSVEMFQKYQKLEPYFEPYLVDHFTFGGSGADIGPLKSESIVLSGLRPDTQRYFDHHHSENDTFSEINKRELELGAAAMSALIYLVDQYGGQLSGVN